MARVTPCIRTYRAVPLTSCDWTPPVEPVTDFRSFQVVPLTDPWSLKALAYAASHLRPILQTVCSEPRSTCTHCASPVALAQRVPLSPSKAALAGVPPFSVDDAPAGLFSAALVVPHCPPVPPVAPKTWNSQRE